MDPPSVHDGAARADNDGDDWQAAGGKVRLPQFKDQVRPYRKTNQSVLVVNRIPTDVPFADDVVPVSTTMQTSGAEEPQQQHAEVSTTPFLKTKKG